MYSEAEMHEYNVAQDKALLAVVSSEEETALDRIGSSSTAPKTPANKDVFINASQKDSEEEIALDRIGSSSTAPKTQMHSIGKIQQVAQIGVKRRLDFDATDPSPAANQAIEEPPLELNKPHEADKAMQEQPIDPAKSASTKKTKAKGKET